MDINGTKLYFVLDASGQPIEVSYDPAGDSPLQIYYYVHNLQGDVTAILNTSGTPVVQYTYDAWGNILSITGSMASTLGVQNPFRYRGYVYDTETGLYYLQSRYYNPEVGRFINTDSFVSTGQGLLGYNMYAYCGNNPVNYIDRTGTEAEALQWWTTGMGWLPFADTVLPFGDAIYLGGILLLGAIVLASNQDSIPEVSHNEANIGYGPPSPNNDEDDDDYYADDGNFGGRQRIGNNKGDTPRNGVFGGRDVYELVVEWNREFLTKENIRKPERSDFRDGPEGDHGYNKDLERYEITCQAVADYAAGASDAFMLDTYGKNLSPGLPSNWKRSLGITLACYERDHVKLKYPIKIVEFPKPYEKAGISPSCPFQGCIYPDNKKAIRAGVKKAFEHLAKEEEKYRSRLSLDSMIQAASTNHSSLVKEKSSDIVS